MCASGPHMRRGGGKEEGRESPPTNKRNLDLNRMENIINEVIGLDGK